MKIKKVVSHPIKSSWIISSVQGNNEMDMWNLETAEREKVLWGSSAPPLTYSPKSEVSYIKYYSLSMKVYSKLKQFYIRRMRSLLGIGSIFLKISTIFLPKPYPDVFKPILIKKVTYSP